MPERRDVRNAPLSPTDGFVLSRVDGSTSERDLADLTGLAPEQLESSLAKLEALGFVTFDAAVKPTASPPRAAEPTVILPVPPLSPPARPDARLDTDGIASLVLSEDVDLDLDIQRAVIAMQKALGHSDHYALLGIDRSADRKAVKRAYFDLAARFHPDKHFRKKLGSFKARMEAIFSRLTLAHDALSDRAKRAEYDAYLDEQVRLRGIEEMLAEAPTAARRAEEGVERLVRAEEPAVTPGSRSSATVSAVPPFDTASRREALARRLLGSRPPSVSTPSAAPPREPQMSATDAMSALRSRYEERVERAKASEARKFAAQGAEALATGQVIAAANAYRVAIQLAPEDAELGRKAKDTQQKANVLLGDTYARQAQYEEKSGQWVEAARSWIRSARARPDDPNTHDAAAAAVVKAGGDLHEAARLALRACELAPSSLQPRLTLARVYVGAGLTQNARRELETAAKLSPLDANVDALRKKLDGPT